MHPSARQVRFRSQTWLPHSIRACRFASASTASVANSDAPVIEAFEPSAHSSGKAPFISEDGNGDVFVDHLPAALAVHPASNGAVVIRRCEGLPAGSRVRPSPRKGSGGGDNVRKTHERRDEPKQMWPAFSVQAKKIYGNTGSKESVGRDDPFEYTGIAQWPQQPWKITSSSRDLQMQRPWLEYLEPTNEDYLKRLTKEIKAYEAYMRLSPEEEAASQLVISDVEAVALGSDKVKALTLLGSRRTGLATPISDFDFAFAQSGSPPEDLPPSPSQAGIDQMKYCENQRKLKVKSLRALEKVIRGFRSSVYFKGAELIKNARVPIVQLKHIATGLNVQIQTMAPYQAAQEYTIACLSKFPSLRPLYIVLRYCLETRALTTPFTGGLGSYSLLMMIVTALKHSNGKFALDDLGGQLLHVLEFYSKANLYKSGFSVEPPRGFDKIQEGQSLRECIALPPDSQLNGLNMMQKFDLRKPYLLCLQDPANHLNDLGKNAYAIKHVQASFNKARESIQAAMKETNQNAKVEAWSCLDSLVRADYRPFEERRSKIARYANGPGQPIDLDYSPERINEEFEKRVKQGKGVADEEEENSEPAPEATDETAAEGP